MEVTMVLVKKGDVAIVTCPFCRKTKKMSVAQYKEQGKRELRIKCSCDKTFCLCLEYRKHPRKKIKLLGESINLSQHRESQAIIIMDISLGGIGFRPLKKHRIQKNDRLLVSFALNDCNYTPIDTDATVRAVCRDHIGCEFNITEGFRPSLGFFLLS
jgi:hypothetical protein